MRKPIGTRVVELLTGRAAIWLAGITGGLLILVVAITWRISAGLLVALPIVLVATAAIRAKDRVWILGRRIVVRRERISRRQMLAMTIAVSVVAGLTTSLGWILATSVRRSYEEQLQRRFRRKPKEPRS